MAVCLAAAWISIRLLSSMSSLVDEGGFVIIECLSEDLASGEGSPG